MRQRRFIMLAVLTLASVVRGSGVFEMANTDSLLIADNAALSLAYGDGWSISVWGKPGAVTGSDTYELFQMTDGSYYCSIIMAEATALWTFRGPYGTTITTTSEAAAEWTNLIMVGYRAVITEYVGCYKNGNLVATLEALTGQDLNPTTTYIGANAALNIFFDGKIAEWALWHSALSAGNIASLQTAAPSGVGSPAVYLPLYDDADEAVLSLEVTNDNVTFDSGDHPIGNTRIAAIWRAARMRRSH